MKAKQTLHSSVSHPLTRKAFLSHRFVLRSSGRCDISPRIDLTSLEQCFEMHSSTLSSETYLHALGPVAERFLSVSEMESTHTLSTLCLAKHAS